MFSNIFKIFIFSIITRVSSFNPNILVPPLGGKVSEDLTLLPVSKSMAFSKIKEYQMRSISRNDPMNICSELNDAREMIRSPIGKDDYASFLISNRNREHLYTILYRVNDTIPYIYTIKAIIRTPEEYDSVNIIDIERMLDQLCKNKRGYLQLFNMKTWANGKYRIEKYLEDQFLST